MRTNPVPVITVDRGLKIKPRWLVGLLAASLSAGAASPPPPPQRAPPRTAQTPAAEQTPDDALIEFLGDNDVPDQKWWEFMKRAGPQAPAPPRQDSKQWPGNSLPGSH